MSCEENDLFIGVGELGRLRDAVMCSARRCCGRFVECVCRWCDARSSVARNPALV